MTSRREKGKADPALEFDRQRRAWECEKARLEQEVAELKARVFLALGEARGKVTDRELDLREALEDYLAKPDREGHRCLAERAGEYRQAWGALQAEESARLQELSKQP